MNAPSSGVHQVQVPGSYKRKSHYEMSLVGWRLEPEASWVRTRYEDDHITFTKLLLFKSWRKFLFFKTPPTIRPRISLIFTIPTLVFLQH